MTISVKRVEHPVNSLLQEYVQRGAYTDCYRCSVTAEVSLSEFLRAFYTTRVFRIERKILALAGRPSTDEELFALTTGRRSAFAAWTVESRTEYQALLCDDMGRTRSWFMISPNPGAIAGSTTLYFGSAVLLKNCRGTGKRTLGLLMGSLLGFHKLYSRVLLRAACSRLGNRAGGTY